MMEIISKLEAEKIVQQFDELLIEETENKK